MSSADYTPQAIINPAEFSNDWQTNFYTVILPGTVPVIFVPPDPRRIALVIGSADQNQMRISPVKFTGAEDYILIATSTGVPPLTWTYAQHGGLVQAGLWASANSSISLKCMYIETLWIPRS